MLFKSVFSRYMVAFMLIILLSFLILALIITSMVQSYSNDQKEQELELITDSVKTYLEAEYGEGRYATFTEFVSSDAEGIQRSLTAIKRYSGDQFVIVTNSAGRVLAYDDATPSEYVLEEMPESVLAEVTANGILISDTDLKGTFAEKHYVYAQQIISRSGFVIGYLFTCQEASATENLMQTMIQMIVLACMWVMCAAIIASYFISERIVRPLRNLSKAAKAFAGGQLDVRVDVRGSDEIAELGMAFNNMASSLSTLEDTRRTFLANVSHDLRTPMTTIAG